MKKLAVILCAVLAFLPAPRAAAQVHVREMPETAFGFFQEVGRALSESSEYDGEGGQFEFEPSFGLSLPFYGGGLKGMAGASGGIEIRYNVPDKPTDVGVELNYTVTARHASDVKGLFNRSSSYCEFNAASVAVICDYNYVFDPNAHLRRFFGEGMKGDYLFLIDEAHNLVERGREMYSASLCKEEVLKIRRLIKEEDGKLSRRLEECNRQMLALKRECEGCRVLDSVSALYLRLLNLMGELERYLEERKGQDEKREAVLEFYFAVCRFVSTCERVDENYLLYSEIREDGKFQVCLFCVNPSRNLQNFLEKGRSAVFFSATLLPIRYYKQLLSTEEEAYAIYARSPFDPANRLLLLGKDVSTRYTRRGEGMYQRYARYLLAAASGKRGNYIAFFPSYRFMEAVYEEFQKLLGEERENPGIECVMQSQYMTEEAREIFLENFEEARDQSLMGFCVMGGIFAEGIDLARDRLIGAVIVGTGLPQVCRERELLKEYFEGKGKKGFDYAYLYPGMNKVLQSAGRVIRTDEDRGVILLLDDRYGDARYRETFPREWEKIEVCTLTGVEERLREFWAEE